MINKTTDFAKDEYRSIRYLNLFRLLLGFFFFSIIFKEVGGFVGFNYTQNIAQLVAGTYLSFAVLIWVVSVIYKKHSQTIGLAALIIDLPFIIGLTLLFGGLNNGWVILAVITIGSFSILSRKSWSIFVMPIIATALLYLLPKFLGIDSSSIQLSSIIMYAFTYFAIAFVGISQSKSYNQSLLLTKLQRRKITDLSQLNNLIIGQMHSGVVAYNEKYQVVFINDNASEMIKTTTGQLLPPTLIKQITNAKTAKNINVSIYGEDLHINSVLSSDEAQASLLFIERQSDINEKSQQVNLATIGQLSAVIAHELRNPMAAIYSAAQLLQESENAEDKELTEIITSQIERSNSIIEDILMMSKPHIAEQTIINISEVLNKFKHDYCLQNHIDNEHIELRIKNKSLAIKFDSTHLNQLLWNLTENAFKHGDGKHIIIVTHNQTNTILLDFINNGAAFDATIEESLFTPFFTTHTQGTGLGLYICREMCRSNNAKLEYLRPKAQHIFRIHVKK